MRSFILLNQKLLSANGVGLFFTSYRFTQITVDPQVKTPGGKTYDVLFIGTDNGKVIKAINAESADSHERVNPVVIEEIQAFPMTVPVRGIKVGFLTISSFD